MNKESQSPRRLYKYRRFNTATLRLLSQSEVYYADPAVFNDPLDCRPVVQIDTDVKTLEKVCYRMLVLAGNKQKALDRMEHHRYMSTQQGDFRKDSAAIDDYTESLRSEVTGLLYEQMRTFGVLSMAARWNCPLMWSHYADEHKGVCIEFDVTDHRCDHLSAVDYDTAGLIKASDLFAWKVRGSQSAQRVIWNAFFYAKAKQWRYEREWRDVARKSGAQDTPLKLNAIYFGLRCDYAVVVAVVKLFTRASPPMKFFEIYRRDNSFQLKRRLLYTDEIEQCGLRSSTRWDFDVIGP